MKKCVLCFCLCLLTVAYCLCSCVSTSDRQATDEQTTETATENNTPIYVSFFGDSISTFDGISNGSAYNTTLTTNAVYYTSSSGLTAYDTWWWKVCTGMDWTLCVNNSYSGGKVTDTHVPTRSAQLHNAEGKTPDVIVIYYGINDFNWSVAENTFAGAYKKMVETMHKAYPKAQIYACTLMPIRHAKNGTTFNPTLDGTTLGYNHALTPLSKYNEKIKYVASLHTDYIHVIELGEHVGVSVIQNTVDSPDTIHPNATGMTLMADYVISCLQKDYQ